MKTLKLLALSAITAMALLGGETRDPATQTVADTDTGLMWYDGAVLPQEYPTVAVQKCLDLTFGGYSDWRLPFQNELLTIFYTGPDATAFHTPATFVNGVLGTYASSDVSYNSSMVITFDNAVNYAVTPPTTPRLNITPSTQANYRCVRTNGTAAPTPEANSSIVYVTNTIYVTAYVDRNVTVYVDHNNTVYVPVEANMTTSGCSQFLTSNGLFISSTAPSTATCTPTTVYVDHNVTVQTPLTTSGCSQFLTGLGMYVANSAPSSSTSSSTSSTPTCSPVYVDHNTTVNVTTEVNASITSDMISSLPLGWNLVGTASATPASVFHNAYSVWAYRNGAYVGYKPSTDLNSIFQLNAFEGAWVQKK